MLDLTGTVARNNLVFRTSRGQDLLCRSDRTPKKTSALIIQTRLIAISMSLIESSRGCAPRGHG